MLFRYLHKMRCKITKKNPYVQEQNACHVFFLPFWHTIKKE